MADVPRAGGERMHVAAGVDSLPADVGPLFVVVGVFDGLHLGHLYLLDELRERASRRGAVPTVITFDHHPDEILTGAAPPLLCDAAERLERLDAAGVGVTAVQHFDLALRMTSYDAFIRRIARAPLSGFLMTPDSAFGHERHGTPEAVAMLGAQMGFDVEVIPALQLEGRPVRSAEIRNDIAAGDLAAAARLLGRQYAIVGEGTPTSAGFEVAIPMPVALPPAGDYDISVAGPGTFTARRSRVRIGSQGTLTVDPGPSTPGRVRIVFD